jgi:tetratricopeptide (TPR) repeat protein
MRGLRLIFCCLLVLIASAAWAEKDFFLTGNQACQKGQYEKALTLYDQAAAQKGYSAALLYNMGNCFAHLQKTGPAVLAYERALLLDPGDRDARTNLALVRSRVHLPDPGQNGWRHIPSLLGPDQWLMGGTTLLAATILLLFAGARRPSTSLFSLLSAAGLALLLAVGMTLAAYRGYRHWQASVLLTDADLRISPFQEARSRHRLAAGQIVKVMKEYKEYVLVQDREGSKGWLRADSLARINDLKTGLARISHKRSTARPESTMPAGNSPKKHPRNISICLRAF